MPTYFPTLSASKSFQRLPATLPICRRLLADQITPVGAFLRLSAGADHAFLLESVVGGEQTARFSFVGAKPTAVLRVKNRVATIERPDGSLEILGRADDPLKSLQQALDSLHASPRATPAHPSPHNAPGASVPRSASTRPSGLPFGDASGDHPSLVLPPMPFPMPRFTGGAVGFAGYDTIRCYENLPSPPPDDRGLDDLLFGIYHDMVIFDHVCNTVLVVANARLDHDAVEAPYDDACRRIDALVDLIQSPGPAVAADFDLDAAPDLPVESTFTQSAFEDAVGRCLDYILAGDIFQVVLSQRLRARCALDPFDIYRALRVVNPSPFMFYLKGPDSILVGASPEILCRVEDGLVTNRPLAGTRARGANPVEDSQLERDLLNDPKDRAEHVMLVDLGRNDVGRVARPGTVNLTDVMSVERYSHVMHLSSNVTGRLAEDRTAIDALRASLPVGTVSGAPKIRAMQIIDELEPVRRGPYGGALGYLDFLGNMDTCIILRTLVLTPTQPAGTWIIDMQAGAGIVAESDPRAEYQETLNKAKALLAAVGLARN